MNADWETYRVFLTVVREGGLAAAARALGKSEQSVRRRLDDLEQRCGFPLFRRTIKGLAPTLAGTRLCHWAEAMDDEMGNLRDPKASGAPARDTVRIFASESLAMEFLTPTLIGLCAGDGQLAIELKVWRDSTAVPLTDADIVVLMSPPDETAAARRVGPFALGLFAHERYLIRAGAPQIVEDLQTHSLIGAESEAMIQRVCGWLGLPLQPVDFGFRTDSMLGRSAALRAGVGIAALGVAIAATEPGLVRVLPMIEARIVAWVVMPRREPRPGVERAADAIVARLDALAAAGGLAA